MRRTTAKNSLAVIKIHAEMTGAVHLPTITTDTPAVVEKDFGEIIVKSTRTTVLESLV